VIINIILFLNFNTDIFKVEFNLRDQPKLNVYQLKVDLT